MKFNPAIYKVAVVLGAFLPAPAGAADWAVYRDSVHDCRLEYPNSLFTQDPLDVAEDFQRFSGPDAQTFIRLMGVDNDDHLTPDGIKAKYLKANVGEDIVYESTKTDFLVLSGFRGDSIFYTRIAVSGDNRTICVLEISYPRQAKRAFDDVVTRMSRSFAAGKQ